MANYTAADVKKLRELTGSGMLDCKNALVETEGDFDKAVEVLRIKGAKDVGKRAERATAEGLVAAKDGALIELNSETDFVAKNAEFQALADQMVIVFDGANIAPTITSTPVTTAVAGSNYTYTVVANGSPAPSIGVSGNPSWLTLSGNVLSGTPTAADIGVSGTITVTASNGTSPDATQMFQITVNVMGSTSVMNDLLPMRARSADCRPG